MTEYRGQIKEFSAAAGQNSEKANPPEADKYRISNKE